jgi:hypothetical protein
MRSFFLKVTLGVLIALAGLSYGGAGVREVAARPIDVVALDPSVVNNLTGAACAPTCDLTNPDDLLAIADADGDGDGSVEPNDFAALDVEGNQLNGNTGELWFITFLTNDENVHFDAGEGLWETGSPGSQADCQPTQSDGIVDEDCDDDGLDGDDAVVAKLSGAGLADVGEATVTVTQSGMVLQEDYMVVADVSGSISGTVTDAGGNPIT